MKHVATQHNPGVCLTRENLAPTDRPPQPPHAISELQGKVGGGKTIAVQ